MRGVILKNIIIVGAGRNGKTTLAKKINEELNYYVIHMDYLMTTLDRAYPQLDVRIAWDYHKATANIAPFIGHFLAMSTSYHDFEDDLNLHKHVVKGNRFVLESGHFDFDKIASIMKTYGIEELKDKFILIGLVQNNKTADEFFEDLRKYDTEDEWTHDFADDDLMRLCETFVSDNREITKYLVKYGFTIYDTSGDREQVFAQIIEDIKSKLA
jgi:adenylate kinase family enzyme